MTWEKARLLAGYADPHYAMDFLDLEPLYGLAMRVPRSGIIVELGVCHGRASTVLAYAARERKAQYVGVDDFSMEGTAGEVRVLLDGLGLPHCILEGKTQTVPWDEPIDLLVIDAGHDEDNIRADINRWLPYLKSGGWVAFDDWDEEEASAHWAVPYYGDLATQGWKELRGGGRMVAKCRP